MVFSAFSRFVVVVLFATLARGLGLAAETAAPRWNILFCFADDWGRYASAYAAVDGRPSINDVIQTPHIDRVAREGVLFRNAFVNSPSCTPCRSSLLSGRYFFNTGRGAILRAAVWDPAIPTFPLLLRDAGYHIGKSYKVWSPGVPADAPFGEQRYAFQRAGAEPNNFSERATERIQRGQTLEQARREILAQVRANFDAFLNARKGSEPWLYFFGPTNTHRTWIKGSGKVLWGIEPERLRGKMPAFFPDVPEVREDVADYLGEAQAWDAYVGVLLERLRESGELDRTIVIISGDHGMPGVPHGKCDLYDNGTAVALVARVPGGKAGRVVDDLVCLPDLAPTLLDVGGVAHPAEMTARSLLAILRDERSGQIEADRTWVMSGRERHVDRARAGNLPYPMRALRTRDFLYIRNFAPERWPMGDALNALNPDAIANGGHETDTFAGFADMDAGPTKAWLIAHRDEPLGRKFFELSFGRRPAEELYDLRRDPDQMNNVAADSAYAARKNELAERLMSVLRGAKDPRVTADGMTFERAPFTDLEAGLGGAAKKNAKKKSGE